MLILPNFINSLLIKIIITFIKIKFKFPIVNGR